MDLILITAFCSYIASAHIIKAIAQKQLGSFQTVWISIMASVILSLGISMGLIMLSELMATWLMPELSARRSVSLNAVMLSLGISSMGAFLISSGNAIFHVMKPVTSKSF